MNNNEMNFEAVEGIVENCEVPAAEVGGTKSLGKTLLVTGLIVAPIVGCGYLLGRKIVSKIKKKKAEKAKGFDALNDELPDLDDSPVEE